MPERLKNLRTAWYFWQSAHLDTPFSNRNRRYTRPPTNSGQAIAGLRSAPQYVRTDCIETVVLTRSSDATRQPGPSRRAPHADTRRRPGVLRPFRVRGRHGPPPRGGHRPVPGRDLPSLPRQGVAVPRARRGRRAPDGRRGGARGPGPGDAQPAVDPRRRGLARQQAGAVAAAAYRPGVPGPLGGALRTADDRDAPGPGTPA